MDFYISNFSIRLTDLNSSNTRLASQRRAQTFTKALDNIFRSKFLCGKCKILLTHSWNHRKPCWVLPSATRHLQLLYLLPPPRRSVPSILRSVLTWSFQRILGLLKHILQGMRRVCCHVNYCVVVTISNEILKSAKCKKSRSIWFIKEEFF